MPETTHYGLYVTDSDTELFQNWRRGINAPTESNMTKIDDALYDLQGQIDGFVPFNIHGLTTTTIADADELAVYDTSAVGHRKVTYSSVKTDIRSGLATQAGMEAADAEIEGDLSDLKLDGISRFYAASSIADNDTVAFYGATVEENCQVAFGTVKTNIRSGLAQTTYVDAADLALSDRINALEAASDVTDIVGTHAALVSYDTSTLFDNNIIKVLADETMNNAITYWRWVVSGSSGNFVFVGSQGPYVLMSSEFNNVLSVAGWVQATSSSDPDDTKCTFYQTVNLGETGINDSDYDITTGLSSNATIEQRKAAGKAMLALYKCTAGVLTVTCSSAAAPTVAIPINTVVMGVE